MKTDSKELIEESANLTQSPDDPFAVDMFVSRSTASSGTSAAAREIEGEVDTLANIPTWHTRLPRVSSAQANASASIAALTPEFYTHVQNATVTVLARYTMNVSDQVSINKLDLKETNFSFEPAQTHAPHRIFLTFASEPNAAKVSLELDARFAAMLIDRMLGSDGTAPDSLRPLTTAEKAVVEFLGLALASEFDRHIGEPLLRLQAISERPPWEIERSKITDPNGGIWNRGLTASFRIRAGRLIGISHVHVNSLALDELAEAERKLHGDENLRAGSLDHYSRIVPDVGLSILIGRTELTPQEFGQLEWGDVMVIEQPAVFWRMGKHAGPIPVRIGDSPETMIAGEVVQPRVAQTQAPGSSELEGSDERLSGLKMRVRSFRTGIAREFAERLKMPEETESTEQVEGNLINNVMLTVHVELAARRIRLDELARLRRDQILELGCEATDPVDLIVDGRRVARGELVDVEGRLGVRVTHVSG